MTAISLDKEINKYLPLLGIKDKQSILAQIKSLLPTKETHPKRLTIEQYNKELDAAEARMDAGEYTSLEDAIKQAETW